MLRSLALLLVLSSLCGSSRADTVDLAEWSRGGWSVTVDGVMGTFTLQVARPAGKRGYGAPGACEMHPSTGEALILVCGGRRQVFW